MAERMADRPQVDFFVIGAARCGTTSLFRHLTGRADVHDPARKEPRFFTRNHARGWDWYRAAIGPAAPGMLVGDFSPDYANAPGDNTAAARIAAAYPRARIVYLVRNPIGCALSNWRMAADGQPAPPDFDTAWRGQWACQMLHRSLFHRQISQYRRHFADAQILVAPLEALRRAPAHWIARIERHLSLPESGAARFPRANASFRKPTRPAAPPVPRAARRAFCDAVAEDAAALLDYAGLPESFWSIGVGASAWSPAD